MSERKTTERTTRGLSETLFDTLDMIVNAEISPERANSIARVSRTILMNRSFELNATAGKVEADGSVRL